MHLISLLCHPAMGPVFAKIAVVAVPSVIASGPVLPPYIETSEGRFPLQFCASPVCSMTDIIPDILGTMSRMPEVPRTKWGMSDTKPVKMCFLGGVLLGSKDKLDRLTPTYLSDYEINGHH